LLIKTPWFITEAKVNSTFKNLYRIACYIANLDFGFEIRTTTDYHSDMEEKQFLTSKLTCMAMFRAMEGPNNLGRPRTKREWLYDIKNGVAWISTVSLEQRGQRTVHGRNCGSSSIHVHQRTSAFLAYGSSVPPAPN